MTRAALGVALALTGDHGATTRRAPPERVTPVAAPPHARRADVGVSGAVHAEMHHVDFHIDSGIILHIERLRGDLLPTTSGTIPTLDDKTSFSLDIHSAEIAIDTASLATLLNRHVFGYKGSPLRKLRVSTEGDQLVQTGVLHKGVDAPFRIRATVGLTTDGRIRIHPTAVRVLGVGVMNVMNLFGLHLSSLITLQPGHGASIEGNDFILDALAILPPPRIRGTLTSIAVRPGELRQTFSPAAGEDVQPLRAVSSAVPNYMFFRGGTLRFGKLTMENADLLIVDADSTNVFDFSLDRYNDQLVAGYSKSTTALGLVVHMPDFRTLGRAGRATGAPTGVGEGTH